MINKNYYPTPEDLIKELVKGIDFSKIKTILEPSAGDGNIIEYINKNNDDNNTTYYYRDRDCLIDCIENDTDLQAALKGKGFKLIHDDFLTFNTFKRYDLIVMNPPFDNGAKHLLKAIELCRFGGKIRCILNAETVRENDNSFTFNENILYKKLLELNASIEYKQNAFKDAERKTGVEIAIIKIDTPDEDISINDIFEKLRKEEKFIFETKVEENKEITYSDFIKDIIAKYNFEIKVGIELIKQFYSTNNKLQKYKKDYNESYFNLQVDGKTEDNINICINKFIEEVRENYWTTLFDSEKFAKKMTSKIRQEFHSKINELKNYDFSEFNIEQIQTDLKLKYNQSVEESIITLFDEFSRKHYWDKEDSANIHYYNGWKTNKAWKINKKIIIPIYGAFREWSREWTFQPTNYQVKDKLLDIEKIFNYLSGIQNNHDSIFYSLQYAENTRNTKNIECRYFNLTFYKKGTLHIEFTNLDVLDKFNIFGSQKKNWLPPGFGKKQYSEMNQEEKNVVNEFCDEKRYDEFYLRKDYFLTNKIELLEA